MNPLELRKIVQVGYSFIQPDGAGKPILDKDGLPAEAVQSAYTVTIAFWIPAPKPFKRCAGETKVVGAFPHELQALKDGAIFEHLQDFTFPFQPTVEQMRATFMPIWDALTADSIGFRPNNVPVDKSEKMAYEFTAVRQPPDEPLIRLR